jgi:hypothetical protein
MHGITGDLDFSFLKDKELIQIAIGQFQVQFHFRGDIGVSVENTFVYHSADGLIVWHPNEIAAAAAPLKLLGKSVTRVKTDPPTTLWLEFENGERLAVVDGSREYESFTVTRPGQTIVV